ncbi:hypothetical protein TNCV_4331441 [Trichonephila clavipes]|nr:hypothetical protein TNCV_4331441 [Trichonephila clavipes]
MTLKRRSHSQLLAEFERRGIINLKKMAFLSTVLQNALVGMYTLCMIVGSDDPRKALPEENYVLTTHGSPLSEETVVFTIWLGNIVLHQQYNLGLFLAPE